MKEFLVPTQNKVSWIVQSKIFVFRENEFFYLTYK